MKGGTLMIRRRRKKKKAKDELKEEKPKRRAVKKEPEQKRRIRKRKPKKEKVKKPGKNEPKLPKNLKGIQNWGGHLFKPPKYCKYKFIASDGGRWVDLAVCNMICTKENGCKWRAHWRKLKPHQRIDFLRKHKIKHV